MPDPRTAFCMFCDDLRMEAGNKISYMGTYRGEIILEVPQGSYDPILFPKFVVMAWLFSDWDDKPERITMRVYAPPGKTEVLRIDIPHDQLGATTALFDDPTKYLFNAGIPIVNFPLHGEGEIEVTIETERETIRAGRLKVRINRTGPVLNADQHGATLASSIAPLPPSEQSPTSAPATKPRRVRRRLSSLRNEQTPERE